MFDPLLLTLILTSVFIGFVIGRWQYTSAQRTILEQQAEPSSEYFAGLNYLLNEQTDEAIDTFINAIETSSDNVETYIIIGRLFRRRGEIEKAIQTHQDILARPCLTRKQSFNVQLELAHNYLKAGLLDRAEALLIELSTINWARQKEAVSSLLNVYEQEKEWKKAINVIIGLPEVTPPLSVQASHYYAELANLALQKNEFLKARQYICKSMQLDPHGVRAILQLGHLEYTLKNYHDAIKVLQKIAHKNQYFISESLELLKQCYDHIPAKRGFTNYLTHCLKHFPSTAVIIAFAKHISTTQNAQTASRFVAEQIIKRPSLRGMQYLINNQVKIVYEREQQQLNLLNAIIGQLLSEWPVYRCANCGFDAKKLHWLCPRCHVWGRVEPILSGPEGQ